MKIMTALRLSEWLDIACMESRVIIDYVKKHLGFCRAEVRPDAAIWFAYFMATKKSSQQVAEQCPNVLALPPQTPECSPETDRTFDQTVGEQQRDLGE